MTKKNNKSVLVATIGTRDLAFQMTDGSWLNIGNDRRPDDKPSQMQQVTEELYTEPGTPEISKHPTFRELTQHLSEHFEQYRERLVTIILGKLIEDQRDNIKTVYLIGTDQPKSVGKQFWEKDTLYAADIVKQLIEQHYNIPAKVILQGKNGENPSNFDEMFRWWKTQVWDAIAPGVGKGNPLLLCLKGGVNQSSEASRITALSRFGESTRFYDFKENEVANRAGQPSNYTEPFRGTNYLWDRTQQQALALLKRYDYAAVNKLLGNYFKFARDEEIDDFILDLEIKLEAGMEWNVCNFEGFEAALGKDFQKFDWWQTAYEAAYLAIVRYEQDNVLEAMFHSFRAVEGVMMNWALQTFPDEIEPPRRSRDDYEKSPILYLSICQKHPQLRRLFNASDRTPLYGWKVEELFQAERPQVYQNNSHLDAFFGITREWRNSLFHRLLRLQKDELHKAWDTERRQDWEERVLGCLNAIADRDFESLTSASQMSQLHDTIVKGIQTYQP
jgi:hypothetical protein